MTTDRKLIINIVAVFIFGVLLTGPAISGSQVGSVESVEGIIAIKEGHGDILIRPDSGSDKRLRVRESTIIVRNGKKATYGDLQARDRVQATYDGKNRVIIELNATGS